jgi:hypothetical protein
MASKGGSMKRKLKFIGAIAIFLFVFSVSASASMITFDLEIEYSGGDPPEGSAPWLSATFDDGGSPGSVQLTMNAFLTGSEFVGAWLFNIVDESLLGTLTFAYQGGSTGPAATTVGQSADAFNAGPAHDFDIEFDFPESNSGLNPRFDNNETVIYDIIGTGITANSFWAENESGKGPFPSAAHIQGIGADGEGSGWIAVSEPATMLLLGSGLVGFAVIGRRKFFKKG